MRYKSTYIDVLNSPLYPFGYGLSYTTFIYSNFEVIPTADGYTARVEVTNTGKGVGREAVQVYAAMTDSRYATPKLQLCGVNSVTLQPGEAATVEIPVSAYWLKVVTDKGERVDPDGGITLYVGGHQPDARSRELGCADCLERSV